MPALPVYRILFVRTDRMGDVLMNLPAIRLLRQAYPKAWITALVDSSVADLLKGQPDLDEVMARDFRGLKKSLRARWRLLRELRSVRYDLAVVSNPEKFLHGLVFLSGIRERVGIRRKWGFLLTRGVEDAREPGRPHQIERNLELVSCVTDDRWDGSARLPLDPTAGAEVERLLAEEIPGSRPILAVHTGTSRPEKRWSAERFARFCDGPAGRRFDLVMIGGPEEADTIRKIQAALPIKILNWAGRLTLRQLAAFLSHPRVLSLVSCDSGPVHVAWMSGKPVVALYAKNVPGSHPDRWGPRDSRSRVIYKPMAEIDCRDVEEALEGVLNTA